MAKIAETLLDSYILNQIFRFFFQADKTCSGESEEDQGKRRSRSPSGGGDLCEGGTEDLDDTVESGVRALQRIHIDDEATGVTSAANSSGDSSKLSGKHKRNYKYNVLSTVVPGFRVL